MKIALVGLGVIGVPIAHRLFNFYHDDFMLVADESRKKKLKDRVMCINNDLFQPTVVSECDQYDIDHVDLIILCVKNYSLKNILRNISVFINEDTIILPLQNGTFAYNFFKEHFPDNKIIQGYVQGPNTEIIENGFKYENPGDLHIGSVDFPEDAKIVIDVLAKAGVPVFYEPDIVKMIWKKWMLNVAGNSVTALTGADYSLFKLYSDLQTVCRQAMREFVGIARAEGVFLEEKDIDDVIAYYVSYIGSKKTSMLMDVTNERKTENDYLAGTALQLAKKHGLNVPIISTLFYMMEVKEEVYMERKGCRATDLYTEGVEYSDALRVQMNDLNRKMNDSQYAEEILQGEMPDQLSAILQYAAENSEFYSGFFGFKSLQDFPVVNKEILKANYDRIAVHSFDKVKTHKMYTSGSTGMPFAVVQDLAKRERTIADLKYFGKLAGYSDHDPMCYLRARPLVSQSQQAKDNIWQLDVSKLSEKNLADYFHVIVEKKCTALIGYASTLEVAVDFWSKHFDNETLIKTIISTSEELKDSTRDKLKAFFGDSVQIAARYSNAEQGILGQEEGISGNYTLNWASYYFEILKMESDEVATPGEIGRIVVTDLYNKAFPMIRYDTGDTGKMVAEPGKLPCLCDLTGRKMDIIYDVNGEPISPFLFSRTMRHVNGVKQWQFIQESCCNYTLLIICDGDDKPVLDNELCDLQKVLGESAQINVEYKDSSIYKTLNDWRLIVSHI